jgi:hypothetical protein
MCSWIAFDVSACWQNRWNTISRQARVFICSPWGSGVRHLTSVDLVSATPDMVDLLQEIGHDTAPERAAFSTVNYRWCFV